MREKNSVTCRLKKMVRDNNQFYFHTYREPNNPSYQRDRHVFILFARKESFKGGKDILETQLDLRGRVGNGYTDAKEVRTYEGRSWKAYSETFEPTKGFWSLLGAVDYFRSAVESVPEDAEVSFEVHLDAGTHDILVEHNLHVDYLIMKIRYYRGTKEYNREFLIDTYTGRHGVIRFGFPERPQYLVEEAKQ